MPAATAIDDFISLQASAAVSGLEADIIAGNALPLRNIPLGTEVHNIELRPGKGGQMARSAGNAATSGYAVTVPSSLAKTSRMRPTDPRPESMQSCLATIVPVARCWGSMQA